MMFIAKNHESHYVTLLDNPPTTREKRSATTFCYVVIKQPLQAITVHKSYPGHFCV